MCARDSTSVGELGYGMLENMFVDVRYRGLEVGRRVKMSEIGPTTAFLQHNAPMPVGTILELHSDFGPRIPVRVSRIWEQVAGAEREPGMRVAVEALSGPEKQWWQAQVSGEDPRPAGSLDIAPAPERIAESTLVKEAVAQAAVVSTSPPEVENTDVTAMVGDTEEPSPADADRSKKRKRSRKKKR